MSNNTLEINGRISHIEKSFKLFFTHFNMKMGEANQNFIAYYNDSIGVVFIYESFYKDYPVYSISVLISLLKSPYSKSHTDYLYLGYGYGLLDVINFMRRQQNKNPIDYHQDIIFLSNYASYAEEFIPSFLELSDGEEQLRVYLASQQFC
jgi:hypothetical protein